MRHNLLGKRSLEMPEVIDSGVQRSIQNFRKQYLPLLEVELFLPALRAHYLEKNIGLFNVNI